MAEDKGYALVTGAAIRVGRIIAIYLAKKGYDIIVHYNTSHKQSLALKAELETQYHVKVLLTQANFNNYSDIESLIPTLVVKNPNIKITQLINSASGFAIDSLDAFDNNDWESNFNSNLKAPYLLGASFAEYVKGNAAPQQRKGGSECTTFANYNIINIVDSWTKENGDRFLSYNLAKHALTKLTKAMALKYAPYIRVNGIAPGLTMKPDQMPEERFAEMYLKTPLQRAVDPEDIAQSAYFMINNKSMTGNILTVDGGKSLL